MIIRGRLQTHIDVKLCVIAQFAHCRVTRCTVEGKVVLKDGPLLRCKHSARASTTADVGMRLGWFGSKVKILVAVAAINMIIRCGVIDK